MSSAVSRELASAHAPMPSRNASPRLRLVGPDERVHRQGRDGPVHKVVAEDSVLRLNLRGRLVVTLMVAAAVVALAVMLAASVDAAAPQIDHATTVLAGQTLTEVAATQLPALPIGEAVARIQLANNLNSSQVHAGQSLLIPAIR